MIDSHCHLEQSDYDSDREEVIERARQELKAVITSCANPNDFELTLDILKRYPSFVFGTVALHPIYFDEFDNRAIEDFIGEVKSSSGHFVGIGECGLDYKAANKEKEKKRQKAIFKRFIRLAEELDKPLIIHSRLAFKPAIDILESHNAQDVLMHFFTAEKLLDRVIRNGWNLSVNTLLLGNKKVQNIVKKAPLDNMLLETDAPWLGGEGRNEPTSVKRVAKKIAQVKGKGFEDVWRKLGRNAVRFFDLPLEI